MSAHDQPIIATWQVGARHTAHPICINPDQTKQHLSGKLALVHVHQFSCHTSITFNWQKRRCETIVGYVLH